MAKFTIVLTGPDGSGKSRLVQELQQTLSSNGVGCTVCSVWDAQEQSRFFKNKQEVQEYLGQVPALSRLLFLAHAFSVSLATADENARKEAHEIVLIDSYIYKYLVTEMTFGMPREKALSVGRLFPKPDLVFFLNAKSQLAAERKDGAFSSYETGLTGRPNDEAFKSVIDKGRAHWQSVRACFGPWIDLDASEGVPELISKIIAKMRENKCPSQNPFLSS